MGNKADKQELFEKLSSKNPTESYIDEIAQRLGRAVGVVKNQDGDTPLIFAIKQNLHPTIIAKILNHQTVQDAQNFVNADGLTCADIAFAKRNVAIFRLLIRRGIYGNFERYPKTFEQTQDDDELKKIAQKTRALFELVDSGDARAQSVEKLINEGAVVSQNIFEKYLQKLISGNEEIDFEQIYKTISLFVDYGVKPNEPIRGGNAISPIVGTFFKIAVHEILKNPQNKNAVFAAISLLENDAAFVFVKEEDKESFVKAVLQHRREYIKTLVEKRFYIAPDFLVDGYRLSDKGFEFVRQDDQISRKKTSIIEKDFLLSGYKPAPEAIAQNLESDMTRGVETRRKIDFVVKEEGGRLKKFILLKGKTTIRRHYGSLVLRALSDKQYAVKRSNLLKRESRGFDFAVKWDDSISNQKLRDQDLFEGGRIELGQANLYGVMAVLGEYDIGSFNALESSKSSRVVRIDSSPFFNESLGNKSLRMRGSLQSKLFLHRLARDNCVSIDELVEKNIRTALDSTDISERGKNDIFIKEYNESINQKLFEKIRKNIAKNLSLKKEFCAFMKGVQDAIDLSKDTAFLDALETKYKDECGDYALTEAKMCRAAFLENVKESEVQFASYLQLYHEIANPKHRAARNFGVEEEKVVAQEDGERWAQAASAGGSASEAEVGGSASLAGDASGALSGLDERGQQVPATDARNRGGGAGFFRSLLRLVGCASVPKIGDDGRS